MFWINTGKINLIMSFVDMHHYYTDKILGQLAGTSSYYRHTVDVDCSLFISFTCGAFTYI